MSVIGSLDRTLELKKQEKYDVSLENSVRLWLSKYLNDKAYENSNNNLHELLKDGVAVCTLLNKMAPGSVGRINNSSLAFKQMENIESFVKACEKLGLNRVELFDTTDLYEGKDMLKVLLLLNRLKALSGKPEELRLLADKVSTHSSKNPSPRQIRQWSPQKTQTSASAPNTPPHSPSWRTRNKQNNPDGHGSSPSGASAAHGQLAVASLQADIDTKEQFKYSTELEAIAQQWITDCLGDVFDSSKSFAENLKSGYILCSLMNKIKPGSIQKIHTTNVAYLQMENISHYLESCSAIGMRDTELFSTPDLFDAKKMTVVLNHIIALAKLMKKRKWSGPIIGDTSQVTSLWSESLSTQRLELQDHVDVGEPLSDLEQDLVAWTNVQFAKCSPPVPKIYNLKQNIKSGVILIKLISYLTGDEVNVYHEFPEHLWQYIENAQTALRLLASHTFEYFEECSARDIVSGNTASVVKLLQHLRDKFDLEYLFNKIMEGEEENEPEPKQITLMSENFLNSETMMNMTFLMDRHAEKKASESSPRKPEMREKVAEDTAPIGKSPRKEEVDKSPRIEITKKEKPKLKRPQSQPAIKSPHKKRLAPDLSPSRPTSQPPSPKPVLAETPAPASDLKKSVKKRKKKRDKIKKIKKKVKKKKEEKKMAQSETVALRKVKKKKAPEKEKTKAPEKETKNKTTQPKKIEKEKSPLSKSGPTPKQTPKSAPTAEPVKAPSHQPSQSSTTSPSKPSLPSGSLDDDKREKARTVVRRRVVNEILTTEDSYVFSLATVVQQIIVPLKKQAAQKNVLTSTEIEDVFNNIEELLQHHLRFLHIIKTRIANWDNDSTIGDIFLDHTSFLVCYDQYLRNYGSSLISLHYLQEKKPKFSELVEKFEALQKTTTALTLPAYLIMPVQRIPRYLLLLRELSKYTRPSHKDTPLLAQAHKKISTQLNALNAKIDKDAQTNAQKIIAIEASIDHLGNETLFQVGRKLRKEGLLKLKLTPRECGNSSSSSSIREITKQYYVFMFNDLLVCCGKLKEKDDKGKKKKKEHEEKQKKFSFCFKVEFQEVTFLGMGPPKTNSASQRNIYAENLTWHMITPDLIYVFYAINDEELDSWYSILKDDLKPILG